MEMEEEYRVHEVPKEIKEQVQDSCILSLNIEDLIKFLGKETKKVFLKRKVNHFMQKIFVMSEDMLQEVDSYYEETLNLIEENKALLQEIREMITEENFQELVKVVDFIVKHYSDNIDYIESHIEGLSQARDGIQYVDNRKKYTKKSLKEFINKKLVSMKTEKQLEKGKKV